MALALARITPIIAALTVGMVATASAATDDDLDPGFSEDGKVTTNPQPGADAGHDVVHQADGKIVVVGATGNNFAVVRYNPDGTLDRSFSGDGRLRTDFGGDDRAASVVIDDQGRLVVAGTSDDSAAVARYRRSGYLDTTFGDGGKVLLDQAAAGGVAIDDSGRLVLGGSVPYEQDPSLDVVAVMRLLPDGSPDTSFDGDGRFLAGLVGSASDVEVDPAGRIVVAGIHYNFDFPVPFYEWGIARVLPDGGLDTSFGDDGLATACGDRFFPNPATGLALGADGTITVTGPCTQADFSDLSVDDRFTVHRFLETGEPDTSFGDGGEVRVLVGYDDPETDDGDRSIDVKLDSQGRAVVAGSAIDPDSGRRDIGAIRVLPDGSLDSTFSHDGKALTDFTGFRDIGNAVSIDTADNIVVAGSTIASPGLTTRIAVLRYLATTPEYRSPPTHNAMRDEARAAIDGGRLISHRVDLQTRDRRSRARSLWGDER